MVYKKAIFIILFIIFLFDCSIQTNYTFKSPKNQFKTFNENLNGISISSIKINGLNTVILNGNNKPVVFNTKLSNKIDQIQPDMIQINNAPNTMIKNQIFEGTQVKIQNSPNTIFTNNTIRDIRTVGGNIYALDFENSSNCIISYNKIYNLTIINEPDLDKEIVGIRYNYGDVAHDIPQISNTTISDNRLYDFTNFVDYIGSIHLFETLAINLTYENNVGYNIFMQKSMSNSPSQLDLIGFSGNTTNVLNNYFYNFTGDVIYGIIGDYATKSKIINNTIIGGEINIYFDFSSFNLYFGNNLFSKCSYLILSSNFTYLNLNYDLVKLTFQFPPNSVYNYNNITDNGQIIRNNTNDLGTHRFTFTNSNFSMGINQITITMFSGSNKSLFYTSNFIINTTPNDPIIFNLANNNVNIIEGHYTYKWDLLITSNCNYEVFLNHQSYKNGTFLQGTTDFEDSIYFGKVEFYNLTLVIYFNNKIISKTIFINSQKDTTPPEIYASFKGGIIQGDRASSIVTWYPSDNNPKRFILQVNNTIIDSGVWNFTEYKQDLSNYSLGLYYLNFTAIDIANNSASKLITILIFNATTNGGTNTNNNLNSTNPSSNAKSTNNSKSPFYMYDDLLSSLIILIFIRKSIVKKFKIKFRGN